jgi:hypothetical protein
LLSNTSLKIKSKILVGSELGYCVKSGTTYWSSTVGKFSSVSCLSVTSTLIIKLFFSELEILKRVKIQW